jgi:nicotinate-nucleotide pyrophosphorylase (carboxylating)
MVMLKDNHIDFAGGISLAIAKLKATRKNNKDLKLLLRQEI